MIPHLLLRVARSVCQVALVALGVSLTASLVRVLPWLAAESVPVALSLAFLRVLALSAAEVTLLVAAPLGCALEVVRWLDDGTARALRTVGVGPPAMASHAAAIALIAGLLILSTSSVVGTWATQPGRLSNALVQDAALDVCSTRGAAVVPLVQVTWMCLNHRPTLVGRIGREGVVTGAWHASEGRFSDDLASVRLRDVHAVLDRPRLTLKTRELVVAGLIPWVEPSGTPSIVRGLGGALAALLASFASAWSVLRWRTQSRAVATAAAVAGILPFFVAWSDSTGLPAMVRVGLTAISAIALPSAVVFASSRARLRGTLPGGTTP